ncbi:MAG: acyl-CoA synthetase [Acidimicrobiia bacterium]
MDWNFGTIFESVADALPDQEALVQGERRRTWREFDDRAGRLANALSGLGLGPDSKVASYLYNSNEYVEGLFATFKIRGVPVNVNYRYLEDELAYLLDNSDAEAVLFHGSLAEQVAKVRDRLPRLRAAIQVDDGSPHLKGALGYEELVETNEPMPRIERSGADYLFLYTGGTTGMPKGVMWRQDDLFVALSETIYALQGLPTPETAADCGRIARQNLDNANAPVHLPASPLMHGTGQFTTFQSLFLGGTIVTLEGRHFDPDELWRVVARERVTNMAIVGDAFAKPMVRALEDAEARGDPYDISSVRLTISSGVMWSAPVKQALMDRQPMICFDSLGSSEGVGFANAISAPGAKTETAKFTIGAYAKVLTEDGREVEPGSGEIGLLAVGGHIPTGYYKDPAKSAATFREHDGRRYSIPGDYATVEADGTVTLLGRGSVCINSGGEKIYPEEVEEAVKHHPAVDDCVVVGVPDDRFGEAVTAVVSVRSGDTVDAPAILDAVDDSGLARFKRPRHVVVVDDVPRAANGKVDYQWAKTTAKERVTR